MNYTYAKSKFKSKDKVLVRSYVSIRTGAVKHIFKRKAERVMQEPSRSNAVPSKPASKQRAKRRRLNPGRRTVEENRRAR